MREFEHLRQQFGRQRALVSPGGRVRRHIIHFAVKAGGERYLPKLDTQSLDEYFTYKARASFFNASALTADGFLGLIFRREPTVKVPEDRGQRSEDGGQRSQCA